MKINISETTERQLDWLVAKCEIGSTPHKSWNPADSGFRPSTEWSQGGPIILRECINVWAKAYGASPIMWKAQIGNEHSGPTPLIAAMRSYVASKLGNEVEIPEELK